MKDSFQKKFGFAAQLVSLALIVSNQCCWANDATWRSHIELGTQAFAARRYPEAKKLFSESLKQAEQADFSKAHLVESLNYVAEVNLHDGKQLSTIVSLCNRSISITEKIMGRDHVDMLPALFLLAHANIDLANNFEVAEPIINRMLRIDSALLDTHGKDREFHRQRTSGFLNVLAVDYLIRNRPVMAEKLCTMAIRLNSKSVGAHFNRATARTKLGNCKGAEEDSEYLKQLTRATSPR